MVRKTSSVVDWKRRIEAIRPREERFEFDCAQSQVTAEKGSGQNRAQQNKLFGRIQSSSEARARQGSLPGPAEMNPSPDGSALPPAPAERGGSGRLRRDACPSARPGEVAPPALAGDRVSLKAVSSVTTDDGGPAAGETAGTDGEAGAEWDKDPGRGLAHGIAAPGDRGGRRIIRRRMNGGPAGGTGRRFRMCRGWPVEKRTKSEAGEGDLTPGRVAPPVPSPSSSSQQPVKHPPCLVSPTRIDAAAHRCSASPVAPSLLLLVPNATRRPVGPDSTLSHAWHGR